MRGKFGKTSKSLKNIIKLIVDSSLSSDNDNLYIRDYKLVRADHPGNIKRGDVYVYFKESLLVSCLVLIRILY